MTSENLGVTLRFVLFFRGRRRLRGEGGTERVRVNLERFGLICEGTDFRQFWQMSVLENVSCMVHFGLAHVARVCYNFNSRQ